jgi:hypothetical protein
VRARFPVRVIAVYFFFLVLVLVFLILIIIVVIIPRGLLVQHLEPLFL